MVRAVVKNGVIHPIDPLPPEWNDGHEVWVDAVQESQDSPDAIAKWTEDVEALAAEVNPKDVEILESAVAEVRRLDRAIARRKAGLP